LQNLSIAARIEAEMSLAYFVIGLDGRPHGPLSPEELLVWIADGRAGRFSRVRLEGETSWRSLQDLPEFTDKFKKAAPFQAHTEEPPTPSPRPAVDARELDALAANYALHARKVDVAASFRRAWALVSQRFVELAGWSVLVGLVEILIVQVPSLLMSAWAQYTQAPGGAAAVTPPVTGTPFDFQLSPAIIPLLIINGVLTGVVSFVYLNAIRGHRARPGEVWTAVAATMGQLFLTGLAQVLLTFAGAFLLLVPGIYLAVAYVFALPLAIDKRLPFWSALEVSRRVVHRQWWTMSLVFVLCAGLPFIGGQLPYGIGLILLMPICTAALMYTYEDLFGQD
jgi:hypothetical protein